MQKVWHLFANGVDQALLTLLVAYSCLANVSLQPALRYEFGQGSLVDTRGSPAHRHSRSGKHVEKWIGKNCVADSECRNQRLADSPDVNDTAVWVETLQSGQRTAKVTVFAEVVIFQNPRVHPMGMPNGHWCEGVTYTSLGRRRRLVRAETTSPSWSTSTGATRAPAPRNAARARGYPGSSIATTSPTSSRT